MTSKERRGNAKSEPATPTGSWTVSLKIDLFLADLNCVYDFFELRTPGTLRDHSSEAETRRPSHKLPALVNNSMSDFAKNCSGSRPCGCLHQQKKQDHREWGARRSQAVVTLLHVHVFLLLHPGEPLNETAYGRGLVVRGTHKLLICTEGCEVNTSLFQNDNGFSKYNDILAQHAT